MSLGQRGQLFKGALIKVQFGKVSLSPGNIQSLWDIYKNITICPNNFISKIRQKHRSFSLCRIKYIRSQFPPEKQFPASLSHAFLFNHGLSPKCGRDMSIPFCACRRWGGRSVHRRKVRFGTEMIAPMFPIKSNHCIKATVPRLPTEPIM